MPDGSVPEEEADGQGFSTSKGVVEVTAEDLADEEWGPVKEKKKKDKKGKGKKSKQQEEEEEEEEKDGRLFKAIYMNTLMCQLERRKICACSSGTGCTTKGRKRRRC